MAEKERPQVAAAAARSSAGAHSCRFTLQQERRSSWSLTALVSDDSKRLTWPPLDGLEAPPQALDDRADLGPGPTHRRCLSDSRFLLLPTVSHSLWLTRRVAVWNSGGRRSQVALPEPDFIDS